MGKKDAVTKAYIKNPDVFADAFNQFLYNGEQRVRPERLRELDTAEITIPYGSDGAAVPEQKYRDALKLLSAMTDDNAAYCIMGIESQSDIHYAMPVRNGVYDFLQLAHQVSEAAKSHKRELKENADLKVSPDEYLSGFWKSDKLIPVVTLVIYFGADEWDAPLSLREMYSTVDAEILKHATDYRINLISPVNMSDNEINKFNSSLREVMLYIKYSKDMDELKKVVNANRNFESIDRQAAEVIRTVTNSRIEFPDGEEENVNYCVAIEQMREESMMQGEIKGMISVYEELGMSLTDTIERIAAKFNLSKEESGKLVNQYWT